MLKKSFTILAAFILGLIISISIMACADDISDYSNEKDTLETLAERIAYLEKEVQTLKKASVAQNIGSISCIRGDDYALTYDKTGRLTQVICDYGESTNIWTCTYNKNVCTLTNTDGSEGGTLTFSYNEESQDFRTLHSIIIGYILQD